MSRRLAVSRSFVVLVLFLLTLGQSAFVLAAPSVQQTSECPTYQVNLAVDLVDATPSSVSPGSTVTIRVHIIYPDGTPVTLSPETLSFLFVGTAGQNQFSNVPVQFTGTAGFYTYSQQLSDDIVQQLGQGQVNVSVLTCSASDGGGNRGPPGDVSSDYTLTPSDNSTFSIGPGPTTGPQGLTLNYIVLGIVAALLLLALLLFLMRSRKKKKT